MTSQAEKHATLSKAKEIIEEQIIPVIKSDIVYIPEIDEIITKIQNQIDYLGIPEPEKKPTEKKIAKKSNT